MMIQKRLIRTVSESKKYIAGNVLLQWCSLAANIALMLSIARMFSALFFKAADSAAILSAMAAAVLALCIRFLCTIGASRMGYLSAKAVKKVLREQIYQKLLRLGCLLYTAGRRNSACRQNIYSKRFSR